MTLSELRKKHPRFIYDNFDLSETRGNLHVSFSFILEPDIVFSPEIVIPIPLSLRGRHWRPWQSGGNPHLNNLIFHLGMIESLSYWKAACPSELVVKAGYLSPDQIAWWKYLFIHGLGEFFFRNRIDFTRPDFLTVVVQPSSRVASSSPRAQPRGLVSEANDISIANARPLDSARDDKSGDLILIGGGKDSIVTLETLKHLPARKTALMFNPGPNSLTSARLAGYENPIIISRKIDSRLLQLNKQGYLNGHTPFSAYLAFLGVSITYLYGYKNVISSNELSAGEGNLEFHGLDVNHQYSKSYHFEKRFREYCARYLNTGIQYFSFLRPLYELQIAGLFSEHSKYDTVFSSCNAMRGKSWCGRCPKCAFSYLSLFPFMDAGRLKRIFGRDLFEVPQIQKHILDLVGLGTYKPFDCVGTKDESILAAALAIRKSNKRSASPAGRQATGDKQQDFLLELQQKLHLDDQEMIKKLEKRIMKNWSNQNFLPPEYSKILKKLLITTKR